MKDKEIKIGQEVFIIEIDLTISKKKIVAIINEEDNKKYKLDIKSCGGVTRDEFYLTQQKAEVKKQDFLDDLKFNVGDLVVFEYKEYSNKKKALGRIAKIEYFATPYQVWGAYKEFQNISDESIFLKVKNEFIENYGNIKELHEKFNEKNKEINKIIQLIKDEHQRLEEELELSIKKNYSVFNWNKLKPKFKDRFSYEEDEFNNYD